MGDKDRIVLQYISEGSTDTHQIIHATTLEAHEVRYSFNKLEQLGLVTLEKREGMVERVINDQKRVFKAPTHIELIDQGWTYLKEYRNEQEPESYENLTR